MYRRLQNQPTPARSLHRCHICSAHVGCAAQGTHPPALRLGATRNGQEAKLHPPSRAVLIIIIRCECIIYSSSIHLSRPSAPHGLAFSHSPQLLIHRHATQMTRTTSPLAAPAGGRRSSQALRGPNLARIDVELGPALPKAAKRPHRSPRRRLLHSP